MRLILLASFLVPFFVNAQISIEKTLKYGQKIGTIYPSQHNTEEPDWAVNLKKTRYPKPGGEDYWSEVQRRKEIVAQTYPRKKAVHQEQRGGGWPIDSIPRTMTMFEGNTGGGGTPNDNNMAISNSGYLISVINSNLYFYDMANGGSLIYNHSLHFWSLSLGTINNKFDPKVIYDPKADKFIMVFLNGTGDISSRYIVCFSTSDDPMQPWNMYALPGNPFDDGSWSDYPALSINSEDLFLTINLLTPGQSWQLGFRESIIWQIDKQSGYDGDTALTSQIWSNIEDNGTNIRNLHPVRNARGQLDHMHHMYFLSNKNFAINADTIYLVKVSGGLINGAPSITIDRIHSSQDYFLTVDAPQPNGEELATNDSRVLGAIFEDDMIQFVQNCTDTATGHTAIYHGFIDVNSMTCSGNIISDSVWSIGYGNIAGVGIPVGSQESMITFEYTSETDFPGYAAIYYDGSGNYSPMKVLKEGESNINVLSSPLERWGDYSGIQRRYNDPCKVWCSGTYGKTGSGNGTWIAEVGVDTMCAQLPVSTDDLETQSTKVNAYPNPSMELITVELEIPTSGDYMISLYDLNGRKVKDLLNERLSTGTYSFQMNIGHLPQGIYNLEVVGTNDRSVYKVVNQ